ncbi:hypothetical protein HK104_001697 [Borealophlyctis nickersoniae]|nr:hypothetical protein HK104_001697 [Borealophlyctis nickersoniae]
MRAYRAEEDVLSKTEAVEALERLHAYVEGNLSEAIRILDTIDPTTSHPILPTLRETAVTLSNRARERKSKLREVKAISTLEVGDFDVAAWDEENLRAILPCLDTPAPPPPSHYTHTRVESARRERLSHVSWGEYRVFVFAAMFSFRTRCRYGSPAGEAL